MTRRALSLLSLLGLGLPFGVAGAQGATAQPASGRLLASFVNQPAGTSKLISPDGRFLLVANSTISIYEISTKRTTRLTDGAGEMLAWSPSMNRIAWVRGGTGPSGQSLLHVWTMAIDSATARPVGAAQRLSTGAARNPAISFDGKLVAYVADDRNGNGAQGTSPRHRLLVAPATGGPERLLSPSNGGLESLHWSRDGKSIYLSGALQDSVWASVRKVYLDGRSAEVIVPGAEWFAGMTIDRTRIITVALAGQGAQAARARLRDTSGRQLGVLALPDGAAGSINGIIAGNTIVWEASSVSSKLVVRALTGSPIRRVPLVGESNEHPLWSPDGRMIAFKVREGARDMLALMNADGSNVQVFRDTDVRDDAFYAQWSSDSRMVGVIDRSWHRFLVLDASARTLRQVMNDTSARVGVWAWGDNTSIVAALLRSDETREGATIEELSLNGGRRVLRRVSELPLGASPAVRFLNGKTMFIRADSGIFMVPLTGGAVQRVADATRGFRTGAAALSADGTWLGAPVRNSDQSVGSQLEMTNLRTGEQNLYPLPFWFLAPFTPQFTPDNKRVLIAGRQLSDSLGSNLYVASTDGSPARAIANLGVPGIAGFSLSPDGKSVVHTVRHETHSSMMSVALPAASR